MTDTANTWNATAARLATALEAYGTVPREILLAAATHLRAGAAARAPLTNARIKEIARATSDCWHLGDTELVRAVEREHGIAAVVTVTPSV